MKKSNVSKIAIGISKIVIGVSVVVLGIIAVNFVLNQSEDGDNIRLVYIGNAEFEAILDDHSGEGTFVYIGRLTCPACSTLRPIVESLPGFDADLAYFETSMAAEEDSDWTSALAERVELRGVPAIIYVENGVVMDRLLGVQDVPTLTDFFERNGGLN